MGWGGFEPPEGGPAALRGSRRSDANRRPAIAICVDSRHFPGDLVSLPHDSVIQMSPEPLTPTDAVDQYLASRQADAAQSTIQNHRYRLKQFLRWADQTGLDDMTEMSGRKAEQYKNWRLTSGEVNTVTLEQQLRTFRVFIRWCESNDAVESGVAEKILVPKVAESEKVRDDYIDYDTAETIIDYLMQFQYATLSHVVFHLLWHTGMRRGTLRALDKEDWYPGDSYLRVRHRDETPLKLGDNGERNISISDERLTTVLSDYVAHTRHDVMDDHGREPLITTPYGRPAKTTLQSHVYRVTRPCYYANECPHDRDPDKCEATEHPWYSKCPSSVSPHPVRRGAITAHLNRDVPMEIASERMNVSVDTLELHYDARSLEEKRQNRKQYLDNL